MPKCLYVDPAVVRAPGQVTFNSIPVNQYNKSVAEELASGKYTKEDLVRIFRDMTVLREFETMLNLIKTQSLYNGIEHTYPGPAHLSIGMCILMMLVGGASGSTAGGIKIVTVMVLLLFLASRARGKNTVTVFKRTIPASQVLDAMTITGIVTALAMAGAIFITLTSPVSFIHGLYESASAIATVGITAGATGSLSIAAQIMIIIFMYFGRVGVLTLSLGFLLGDKTQERFRYADTNLLIG